MTDPKEINLGTSTPRGPRRVSKVLKIYNFDRVPFNDVVREIIEEGLRPLTSGENPVLEIDFGGEGEGDYSLDFAFNHEWSSRDRTHCWYHPLYYGITPSTVDVEAIRMNNYCENIYECDTCTPIFPENPEMLGKQIGHTALHEIGHMFGLMSESSYTGANPGGHTGDPRNCMFTLPLHEDYRRRSEDYERTTNYIIRTGDNLSRIARRIGLRSWVELWNFRGRDGRYNRDILRSGDPNLIFPEEEIWITDIQRRIQFIREVNLTDKSFTAEQISAMRQNIEEGRDEIIFG